MVRSEPSKEATLKEVLAEVSIADVGGMLKRWLKTIGCLGIFLAIVFVLSFVFESAGFSDWGVYIPSWLWPSIIAWGVIYETTSERSYHNLQMSWYFPKQNWFSSLLLAAYGIGFIYLLVWVFGLEKGLGSALAYLGVWLGYTAPFTAFFAVISLGHAKLMVKRQSELDAANNR